MKKNFKRIFSLFLACVLCFSLTSSAFAAENENLNNSIMPAAAGQVLYGKSVTFSSGNGNTSITTTEANWDAQFIVWLFGDSNTSYYVSMRAANGTEYTFGWMTGNGQAKTIDMTYAKAGTYTFYVTCSSSPAKSVDLLIQILD